MTINKIVWHKKIEINKVHNYHANIEKQKAKDTLIKFADHSTSDLKTNI